MQRGVIPSGRGKFVVATGADTTVWDGIPSAETRPRALPEILDKFRLPLCRCRKSLSEIEIAERTIASRPIPPSRTTAPRRLLLLWSAIPPARIASAMGPNDRPQKLRSAPIEGTLFDLDSWPRQFRKNYRYAKEPCQRNPG